jgi:DNA-binding GntR family transcriptional regulator
MNTDNSLKQIPKITLLPEAVYHQLKSAILNGVFKPGQVLRQEDIAHQLGVSRGPLRETLPRLEAEGLIVSMPHKGCAVVSLAPDEIAEIFELRAMLEGSLARAAAQQRDPQATVRLLELNAQMRNLAVSNVETDRQRWSELNYELHSVLLAVAGRRHHMRLVDMARDLAEPYIRMEINLTGSLLEPQREHEMLIEAFAVGDCQGLEKLAREHIQKTAQRLQDQLKKGALTASKGTPG